MDELWSDELQMILDAMPLMFFQKDTKNRILRANQAAADAVGTSVESLVGSPTTQWFPDEAGDYYKDDLEVMRSARPRLGIIEQLQVEGPDKHWIRTDKFPHYDEAGGVDGILVFIQDATAEALAEDALRKSEERLRTIVESEPECVMVLAPDGSVMEMNPAGLSMAEAACFADVQGRSVYDLVVPEHRQAFEALHRMVRSGGSGTLEYQIVGLKGRRRWLEAHAVPLVGIEDSFLAISRDVSERRHAEQKRLSLEAQIRHAQRLESIGVLAGGVAHDFNNHLMAIIGNTDLVLAMLGKDDPGRKQLGDVMKAARQAADVCNQLLTYAGKRSLQLSATNISTLLHEISDLLRVTISKKAELLLELSDSLPAVDVDPSQITQILINLVTNAADALGDESGRIRVATGVRYCDAAELAQTIAASNVVPGRYVYVSVTDSGYGMTPAIRDQIFEPFFTTKIAGRGLGLATVLGTIRGHSGAVKVDSEPGLGTTFEVLFPSTGSGVEIPRTVDELPVNNESAGPILLADDEDSVRNLLKAVLENAGYKVMVATNGSEAVEVFAENSNDIAAAILDITMPGLNGLEVYAELNRLQPRIPVLFSSGYPEQIAIQEFDAVAQVDFIQKPYTGSELLIKLGKIMAADTENKAQ